jgi:hypothetical protein
VCTINTAADAGLMTCVAAVEGPAACGLIVGSAGGTLALVDLRGSSGQGTSMTNDAAAPPVLTHAYGVRALVLSCAPSVGGGLLASIGAPRPPRPPEMRGGGGYRAGDSRGRAAAVGTDMSVLQVRA